MLVALVAVLEVLAAMAVVVAACGVWVMWLQALWRPRLRLLELTRKMVTGSFPAHCACG